MNGSLGKTRRRRSVMAFEMIRLDRTAREPLHQQLYRQIRDELASGNFSGNFFRLPSSRELAADLGISRLTVRLAFSKLHAEGYLRFRIGSGTFIADPLPDRREEDSRVLVVRAERQIRALRDPLRLGRLRFRRHRPRRCGTRRRVQRLAGAFETPGGTRARAVGQGLDGPSRVEYLKVRKWNLRI